MITKDPLKILVLGYIVRGPLGGLAWHHLHYVLGLALLGHDVRFLEDSGDYPSCYDPIRHVTDADPSYGLRFAKNAFGRLGLSSSWAYHDAHTSTWHGPASNDILSFAEDADLLINVSGVNPLRPFIQSVPVRVFIDTDPVFTQIRNASDEGARSLASGHNVHVTFGENLASVASSAPSDGFSWHASRQPIVLSAWPGRPPAPNGRFTTVMQWDSYTPVEFEGTEYGTKSAEFPPFMSLPRLVDQTLELAVGSPHAPRDQLAAAGWLLEDPLEVTRDPWTYQEYVEKSKAEFSVAKHAYVVTGSGWFSERSAAYLASGRPVVVQDTGFTRWLPSDKGVVAFHDVPTAVEGIRSVAEDYVRHCSVARELAHEYFDHRRVLGHLLDAADSVVGS